MKTARVAHAGALHEAHPHEHGLQLADGRVLAEHEVVWLPPFEARCAAPFAVGRKRCTAAPP